MNKKVNLGIYISKIKQTHDRILIIFFQKEKLPFLMVNVGLTCLFHYYLVSVRCVECKEYFLRIFGVVLEKQRSIHCFVYSSCHTVFARCLPEIHYRASSVFERRVDIGKVNVYIAVFSDYLYNTRGGTRQYRAGWLRR